MALKLRDFRHWWQRRTRGWDDSDTWGLDGTIAEFVLPRLRRFKELNNGFPGHDLTWESWNAALDDMIYAMDICDQEKTSSQDDDTVDWERVQRGLELFGKHFRDLWW